MSGREPTTKSTTRGTARDGKPDRIQRSRIGPRWFESTRALLLLVPLALALLLLGALAASCASAGPRVRIFPSAECPPGWAFLYTERAHERGGVVERAVCREVAR